MLSYQLNKELNNLSSAFKDAEYLIKILDLISPTYSLIISTTQISVVGGNALGTAHTQLTDALNKLRSEALDISPKQLFTSIDKLIETIAKINIAHSLKGDLEAFSNSYEEYIKQYGKDKAIALVINAQLLDEKLKWFQEEILTLNSKSEYENLEYPDGQVLSLVLLSSMNMFEFIEKIKSIQTIYLELCNLMDISPKEYPIEIIKIESGSLLVKIFGHNKIMELLSKFIESAAKYFYHKYTNQGKRDSNIENVQNVLALRDNLQKSGIDVSKMDEQITQASNSIAKELNTLISGEPEITVNEKTISVGEAVNKNILENKELLELENNQDL